jgi:glucokinase
MILAGDIGGTNALLLLAALRQGRVEPVLERRYSVASFSGFSPMLARLIGSA